MGRRDHKNVFFDVRGKSYQAFSDLRRPRNQELIQLSPTVLNVSVQRRIEAFTHTTHHKPFVFMNEPHYIDDRGDGTHADRDDFEDTRHVLGIIVFYSDFVADPPRDTRRVLLQTARLEKKKACMT